MVIVDGFHDNTAVVRTAVISQKYKVMSFVLRKGMGHQVISAR